MKSSNRKSNFIVQGGILGIAGIIVRIIGMIYRIPVTNIIGPEGNGYYAAAFQVYTVMLLISSYSLPLAVSKLVSARMSKGQYKNASRVFNGALLFAAITGTIVCVLIFFGAEFFAGRIMSEPLSAIALRIFAPTLLVVAIMGVVRGYFQGMGTMVPTAISQIIEQIINAVVSILAAKYLFEYGKKVGAIVHEKSFAPAYGAAGSTLGTSTGALAGLFFLIIVLMLIGHSLRVQMRDDNTLSRDLESYGSIFGILVITVIPVILSTAIYNISELISNAIFNKMMIKKGLENIKSYTWGVYSGEYKLLLNVPIALSNAMSASVVPSLTGALADGNMKGVRRKIGFAMRFTMLISFPCAVGLGVLSLPIMSMLFKDGYDQAAALMRLGCINIILYSISTLSNGMLQGINHMSIPVRNACVALVAHITVLLLLLDRTDLGIYSVVIANFCFALLMSVLNHLAIRKYTGYRQEVGKTFLVPAVSAIIMGLVIFVFYKIFSQSLSNMVCTILSIGIGAIVYCISVVKLKGIREDEITSFPMGRTLLAIFKLFRLM